MGWGGTRQRNLCGGAALLGGALCLLAWAAPAAAWHGPRWFGPPRVPALIVPVALPAPGPRFFYYYPPGLPLSVHDPQTGTTYCFSQGTGLYFVCGYSRPARPPAEPAPAAGPSVPPVREEAAPDPSGVLLFQLPPDAEAFLDGEPVGLSRGLGVAAVPPGEHHVVVRAGGAETERTVGVAPRAIVTITAPGPAPHR